MQQSIDAYKADGMDESTAFWHAVGDQALNMGLDFLGGAISGGVMAGGSSAINSTVNGAENRRAGTGSYGDMPQNPWRGLMPIGGNLPAPSLNIPGQQNGRFGESAYPRAGNGDIDSLIEQMYNENEPDHFETLLADNEIIDRERWEVPDAEVKVWTDTGWADEDGPSVRGPEGPESVDVPGESGIIDKPDGATALSPIFMSHTDQSFINMKDVKPIEGYEDVAIHGSPYYAFGYGMDGLGEIKYTAQDLADMLVESGTWHGGDIRLLSCEAGARADGLAQQLADILGVRVMAPDKVLYTVPGFGGETRFYIGSEKGIENGQWVTFIPRGVKR